MSDLESLLYVLSTLIVTLLELVFPTILLYTLLREGEVTKCGNYLVMCHVIFKRTIW